MKNEYLEEIWKTRKEIEEEEGGDIRKVFERMRIKTAKSARKRYAGKIRVKATSKTA